MRRARGVLIPTEHQGKEFLVVDAALTVVASGHKKSDIEKAVQKIGQQKLLLMKITDNFGEYLSSFVTFSPITG